MNRNRIAIAALLVFISVTLMLAQGPGPRSRMYNPATEVTVHGMIDDVQQLSGGRAAAGTHFILKSGTESFDVHVGPSDFVSNQGFTFAKGDHVEVIGSKIKVGTTEALIAREIKKDGKVLTLRNAQGIPAWSGGRRRAG